MKHSLIYTDEKSNKFWQIETNDNSFTVTYGKTGTNGQTSTKTFADIEICEKEANKLLAEKRRKGYQEEGVVNRTVISTVKKINTNLPPYRILSEEELINEIIVSDYINPDNRNDLDFDAAIVFDNDLELETFGHDFTKNIKGLENYYKIIMLVKGDLTIKESIILPGTEELGEFRDLIVLGNVTCKNIRIGWCDITIGGNLAVKEYIVSGYPDYEQGSFVVKGNCEVPYIFQKELEGNPSIYVNGSFENKYWDTEENEIFLTDDRRDINASKLYKHLEKWEKENPGLKNPSEIKWDLSIQKLVKESIHKIEVAAKNNVTSFDFLCQGLEVLPDFFFTMTKLEELKLGGVDFDERIDNLSSLRKLDIRFNYHLTEVNKSLITLEKLTDLSIHLTPAFLPFVFKIRSLKRLKVSDSIQLFDYYPENFNQISHLKNLEILDIKACYNHSVRNNNNNLKTNSKNGFEFPVEFTQLPNLRVLDLELNTFSGLGDSFTNLSNLEEIRFSGGCLKTLPDLGKLKKLKKIFFTGWPIDGFVPPQSLLFQLLNTKIDSLEELDISNWGCNLPTGETVPNRVPILMLPDFFDNFPNLKIFKSRYNNIIELPPSLYRLKCLKQITILGNEGFEESEKVKQYLLEVKNV